jgi:hypothetical protein
MLPVWLSSLVPFEIPFSLGFRYCAEYSGSAFRSTGVSRFAAIFFRAVNGLEAHPGPKIARAEPARGAGRWILNFRPSQMRET